MDVMERTVLPWVGVGVGVGVRTGRTVEKNTMLQKKQSCLAISIKKQPLLAFPFWLFATFNRNSNKYIQDVVVFLFLKSIYARLRKTTLLRIVYCHFLASCTRCLLFRLGTKSNIAQKERCVGELLGSSSVQTVYIFSPFSFLFLPFLPFFRLFLSFSIPFPLSLTLFASYILPYFALYSPIIYFFSLSLLSLIP